MRSLFSKVALRPTLASSLARRVLAPRATATAALFKPTAAPVRLFASKVPAKLSVVPAPAPKVSPAAQLQSVRTELAALIEKERDEAGGAMTADHPYAQYVSENKLTITENKKDERIVVSKTIHGYDVTVNFAMSPDPDDGEGEGGEEGADEEGKKKEESGDEQDESYNYSFVTDVKPAGQEGPVFRVFAVSSKENKLYFEGLSMAKTAADVVDFPQVDYNDLSTATQDKIADFMDLLKVDDTFAQFVPAVAAEMSRQGHYDQLTGLHGFLSAARK